MAQNTDYKQAWKDVATLVTRQTVSDNPSKQQKEDLEAITDDLVKLFGTAGVNNIEKLKLNDKGSNLLIYGTAPAAGDNPASLPTVLLYAHYDVVPAEGTWDEPGHPGVSPFTPVEVDDKDDKRMYGRGAADDKSGIVMHLAALRTLKDRLPVNVILVIEGEEETGTGTLDDFIKDYPERFQADVIVIADTGNTALGTPTLTTSLRGLVACEVRVDTLDHAEHSGMFGGPAPDAFMVLVRILNTLLDEHGDVAVAGLKRYTDESWPPSTPKDEKDFRDSAGVLDGVQLTGTGSLTQRLAGSPSICVVGLDGLPAVPSSINQLHPSATARISVRLAPDQSPTEAYEALKAHLLKVAPFGVVPTISGIVSSGNGYHIRGDGGRYFATAQKAISDAYKGLDCVTSGLGGTIPMINVIADVQTTPATVVMWGCEEPRCRIHGTLESLSQKEFNAMIDAEINLLTYVASPL